jgi:hypothetical protein
VKFGGPLAIRATRVVDQLLEDRSRFRQQDATSTPKATTVASTEAIGNDPITSEIADEVEPLP